MTFLLHPALEGTIRLTQGFGWRPAYYAQFGLPGHEGIDMVGSGKHTLAAVDGIVTEIGWRKPNHPYGYAVRMMHQDGDNIYRTIYAHGKPNSESVAVGDRVPAGTPLIEWDSTGNVQGAHLHLTLTLDGATFHKLTSYPLDIIDPTPYLVGNANEEAAFPCEVRVIATDGLRVRSGPDTTYPKVMTLPFNTRTLVVRAVTTKNLQWGCIDADSKLWISLIYTERV